MEDFVPHLIGFQHISHEDFVRNRTTPIAKTLFANDSEDAAFIVTDGTYIYLQKSADYEFQRLSYSLHKNRPLVKPMVIVGTDGYILSVRGPYFANAKDNDAAITKHMISVNAEGMNEWSETSDVCVVDRRFRDVVDFLREQEFNVEMPVYLKKGSKQHSVEEANASRLVTKVRWSLKVYSDEGDIEGWHCTCKAGARVVGCCAHVASVLWYLGYQRLEQQSVSRRDFKTSILDASHIPSSDESDCDSLPEE
ncbi:unnamed protein product [Mytilus coruscus]|uniref:SWIM-type domain-containing protein n=1 Tax=Mytilus coruscus TaxID=42192 RepID=A0A6J8BWT1_MYTCO|nr:unnamed protein product [Mytilus coruscus]